MKVAKTDYGLLVDATDQLEMLAEHLQRARAGEVRSVKVIAPILRDLVCKYRSNKSPLLFRLANRNNIPLQVDLDVPPHMPSTMTLHEYLGKMAFASATENILLTNEQLIKGAADQVSIAHTDNGIDSDIFGAMGWGEIRVGGYPPHVYSLINIGEVVLGVGMKLIAQLKTE